MGSEALRPKVAQLGQIALATDDVAGLRDFYRLLGGVPSPPCVDRESGLQSCILDFCGVRLDLLQRPDVKAAFRPSLSNSNKCWLTGV